MNPLLKRLQPYPFQRLRALLAGVVPAAGKTPINLSIGEPKHPTPAVLCDALTGALDGLAAYPPTLGEPALRQACGRWLQRRYGIEADTEREILPVNGSREALFAFVQAMIDPSGEQTPVVISPNPFYQIYEGAALLAGAEPWYVNCTAANDFQPDWASVPESVWQRTQVVFVCSPGNPTGAVMSLEDWRQLFALSDRHGFVIASDECYSEIHFGQPPLGGLQAARQLGRDFSRIVMFTSLSKRSNAPGLRSGFVAGDASLLEAFLLYRTYHGSAMSPTIQRASIAAWDDEAHVEANRAAYQAKFDAVVPLLADCLGARLPDASFYLWLKVPGGDDQAFTRRLLAEENITVLPGSFLARDAHGSNPGQGYIRIALVAPLSECVEAAERIRYLVSHSSRN
ncbi:MULTISPECIES: succinyldiaminopimelate transaminase [unclassified Paludibacterium]|uniref:succinyldiaminopimelate transaminase n=1 Tax=unclassified Paludibacterium TaxID=2618429 RepID=UPI001C03FF71|nr:succinyldiaminopimelate transaminase [Paludibacterium sp. B53371]BEV72833.1 succinyldiaminopimelate transaminase [Paludibacterium sp. THUN1379]